MSLTAPRPNACEPLLAPSMAGEYTFAATFRQSDRHSGRRFASMPGKTRQLIVNADDFGISRGVNRGIVEAHRQGLVTSASLMANLPSAEDALTRAATCPNLGLGLHLTLTAGRPLTPPERVPSLVDADGSFHALGTLLARLSLGKVRAGDLRRELSAQVEWSLKRGVLPDHLNSHHHVHIHPRVTPIVVALAREHGVAWVRSPLERGLSPALLGLPPKDAARTVAISAFGLLTRLAIARAGLHTTRQFRGIGLGPGFGQRELLSLIEQVPPGLTELMTHPGYPDDELLRLTVFGKGRDRELSALTAPVTRDAVRRRRIRLTSFGWLARRGSPPEDAYT
jgi:hopanoid biosynthesis associated protein HpnK